MEKTKESGFEQKMEAVGSWIEKNIAPPLLKVGNQRHFVAIRATLIRIIPLIIIGSIPLILTNLPVESWANAMKPYSASLNTLFSMTFGFIGLFLAISIGAELGRMYKMELITVSIVTAGCFLITVAPINLENGTISTASFGASGMFTAFIVGIVVVEVMKFMKDHGIAIKMPEGVPENVAASFGAMIPMFILFLFFWLLRIVLNFDLNVFLNMLISPLLILSDTWYAVLIAALLLQVLWFVGIHGGSLTIWGVLYPFLISNLAENATAAQAGQPLPHVFTEPFVFSYGIIGGVGITLPLIFYWWNSKSTRLKEVARVSLGPGIFNINEPIMFGSPIILNPILFLPFVLGTTTFGMLYGYVITRIGLVTAPYIHVPWTTPLLIQPYLSTGGDFRAVIAQAILIVIVTILWYPFAKLWEKKCIAQEIELAANSELKKT